MSKDVEDFNNRDALNAQALDEPWDISLVDLSVQNESGATSLVDLSVQNESGPRWKPGDSLCASRTSHPKCPVCDRELTFLPPDTNFEVVDNKTRNAMENEDEELIAVFTRFLANLTLVTQTYTAALKNIRHQSPLIAAPVPDLGTPAAREGPNAFTKDQPRTQAQLWIQSPERLRNPHTGEMMRMPLPVELQNLVVELLDHNDWFESTDLGYSRTCT